MAYQVTIPVDFACSPRTVYEALADIGRYPEWVSNMRSVSHNGAMHPGLHYVTVTEVLGRTNRTEAVVKKMVQDRLITVQSRAGLVNFTAEYHLAETANSHCRLTLHIQMSFSPAIFNLARPVVEAVAESRIRGELENLRTVLERKNITRA